ncbi:MAG: SPOR domain-containing protein [Pseudomonadota bacterium]
MADLAGDPYGDPAPGARDWRRQAALALGGVLSLALIWALANWAYGLTTRDAGQIPFLKAENGPFRVAPEDPGGLSLDGADRAVVRILDGERPDETVVAPGPEMPAAEDLPAPLLDEAASSGAETGRDAIDAAVARALAENGVDDARRPEREEEPETPDPGALAPAASPFVPARPRDIAAATAAEPAPEPTPAIGSGDVVVQLGAFDSEGIAESEWRRHLQRNEDLLGELTHVVTTVESGGRTLYRLRAGPLADSDGAEALCAALKGRGDACLATRMR